MSVQRGETGREGKHEDPRELYPPSTAASAVTGEPQSVQILLPAGANTDRESSGQHSSGCRPTSSSPSLRPSLHGPGYLASMIHTLPNATHMSIPMSTSPPPSLRVNAQSCHRAHFCSSERRSFPGIAALGLLMSSVICKPWLDSCFFFFPASASRLNSLALSVYPAKNSFFAAHAHTYG